MTLKNRFIGAGLALCMGVSLGLLTNCVGYVETSRVGYVSEDDDYVYYPDYDVYYSQRHHQYVYQNGNSWERRDEPSTVSISVLGTSPSYQMTFHDSPEHHQDDMRRKYPGHRQDHDNGRDHDDNGKHKGQDKHDDNK